MEEAYETAECLNTCIVAVKGLLVKPKAPKP